MKSQSLNVDRMINQFGEFTSINDVLTFLYISMIKPGISVFSGLLIKIALSIIIVMNAEFTYYEMLSGIFYVPLDLVFLLTLFWCMDIITGLIRAKFIKKQPLIPAKVLMWFMRGVIYLVGLSLLSAFFNVTAKYFGDIFLNAQAFVFLVVSFTELWSNIRNIFGHNMKNSVLGFAMIGLFSGVPIREILKNIVEDDSTIDSNN